MNQCISINYTAEDMKKSVALYWKKKHWRWRQGLLATALLVVAALFPLIRAVSPWTALSLFAFVTAPLWLTALEYFALRRLKLRAGKQVKSRSVNLSVRDDGITFDSDLGAANVPWTSIREVIEGDGLWVLVFGNLQFSCLPLDQVPANVQQMILRQIHCSK